jgi:hypothetical protein
VGQLAAVQFRQQHQRLECQCGADSMWLGSGHMRCDGPRHRTVSIAQPEFDQCSRPAALDPWCCGSMLRNRVVPACPSSCVAMCFGSCKLFTSCAIRGTIAAAHAARSRRCRAQVAHHRCPRALVRPRTACYVAAVPNRPPVAAYKCHPSSGGSSSLLHCS